MTKVTKIKWVHDASKGYGKIKLAKKKKSKNLYNWRPTPQQAQDYKDKQILKEILQHID
jgi:hypothetical protein